LVKLSKTRQVRPLDSTAGLVFRVVLLS